MTVIRFWVSVPVLSEQITVALPKVSTAGSFRITAFFFTIRCTPSESMIVTMAGKPSGIAATARLTDVINISNSGCFFQSPTKNMIMQIPRDRMPRILLVWASQIGRATV